MRASLLSRLLGVFLRRTLPSGRGVGYADQNFVRMDAMRILMTKPSFARIAREKWVGQYDNEDEAGRIAASYFSGVSE